MNLNNFVLIIIIIILRMSIPETMVETKFEGRVLFLASAFSVGHG